MAGVELRAVQDIAHAISSSDELPVVLQGIAEAIAGGRIDRDVYVYVFDVETNELVLAGATESPAARQVGTLRVAYGDGVTGWVAASRQSYLIADELSEDPHFLAYPGIGEEQYGAIFSVPIVSRTDDLLGCITVWATNGHRFDPSEVPFVERVASLVAGTFETEKLLEATRHHTRVADGVAELAAMVASGAPIAQTLDSATEMARDTTHSSFAITMVTDPSGADRMHIKALAPAADHAARALFDGVRHDLLNIDQDIRHGRLNWRAASEQVGQVFRGIAHSVTTATVRVGADELGILACYRLQPARFTTSDVATVATISHHAATALKLALLSEELTQRHGLSWFLRDLSSGRAGADELRRRASALGLDNAGGYTFVVGSIASQPVPGVDVSSVKIGPRLDELLAELPEIPANTHFAVTAHQTVALVPWNGEADAADALRVPLLRVCARLRSTTGTALTFGVSRPVSAIDEFSGALAEAREAMAIGSTLASPNGVFTLDDVGHHLLLNRVSGASSVRDRYATAIARIAEYDRVKGTDLLNTLAAFLHFRSQTAASRDLFVHRNTLNQRLTRASQLSGFDILAASEWFPLQLALKVHQAKTGTAPPTRDGKPLPAAETRHDAI
jgi:sugar diacid utilization regulator/putative methionine-R-sulfoxide reductase with GAF domain